MTFRVLDEVDITSIIEFYNQIEKDIPWIEYPNGKQAGLQYHEGSDPWSDAVGRMKKGQSWTENVLINPFFKGTIFEEIISKYKITRTRLMWLRPYSCYSMHRDDSPRLHIPLITNDHCFFIFREHGLFNMPTGHAYWVDTQKEHSAMNCSTEWRLHLLGAL
jgi:hypothetical protein